MSGLTKDVLSVFFGGVLGTFLRLQIALLVYDYFFQGNLQSGHYLAMAMTATLLVNVIGAFLLGALWALYQRGHVSGLVWRFCGIGMLGAFTTFSAYALDAFIALQLQLWALLSLYLAGSVLLSVLACAIGYWALGAIKPATEKNEEITGAKDSR